MTRLDEQARLAVEGVDVISEVREAYDTGGTVEGGKPYLIGERVSDYVVPASRFQDLYPIAPWPDVNVTVSNDNLRTVATATERKGDWMQTYTGRKFWPLDPRADEICIEDIAHALSMQCRYGGHSLRFYSVSEHSVIMSRFVSPANALWALLHDASEAYLADVPRPLKRHLPGYKDAEAAVMAAVCDHFGLPHEMPAEVHEADGRIIGDEIRQNMRPMEWHAKHDNPLRMALRFYPPDEAKIWFLDRFKKLMAARDAENMRVAA